MSSRAPPIPPDQRSAPNEKPHIEGDFRSPRRDSGLNSREQGRHGSVNPNSHQQGHQQAR